MKTPKQIFATFFLLLNLIFLGYGIWNRLKAKAYQKQSLILAVKLDQVENRNKDLVRLAEKATKETINLDNRASSLEIQINDCKNQ